MAVDSVYRLSADSADTVDTSVAWRPNDVKDLHRFKVTYSAVSSISV